MAKGTRQYRQRNCIEGGGWGAGGRKRVKTVRASSHGEYAGRATFIVTERIFTKTIGAYKVYGRIGRASKETTDRTRGRTPVVSDTVAPVRTGRSHNGSGARVNNTRERGFLRFSESIPSWSILGRVPTSFFSVYRRERDRASSQRRVCSTQTSIARKTFMDGSLLRGNVKTAQWTRET